METKERPILFNTEMVKAILDGRKTQTRRIIKPQPKGMCEWDQKEIFENIQKQNHVDYEGNHFFAFHYDDKESQFVKCPFGKVGDRFWVKENYRTLCNVDMFKPSHLNLGDPILYQSDGSMKKANHHAVFSSASFGKCRPSIFMMKWMSRINLEITNIRVERIGSISIDDAKKEGVDCSKSPGAHYILFQRLWDSIYEKQGLGFDANPWVWIVDFKRVQS